MTNKLADALRPFAEIFSEARKWAIPDLPADGQSQKYSMGYMINAVSYADFENAAKALTEHEAAKAATSDDVREAVDRLSTLTLGSKDQVALDLLITAALRQGVTVPREVFETEFIESCQKYFIFSNVKAIMRLIKREYPDGIKLKGEA